jgi:vacuolar-type H+-ATPase subunit F/Vma7
MPKVIVIGRRADILPFRALGSELIEIEDETKVSDAFENIKHYTEPVMVMITEDLVSRCSGEIAEFRENALNMVLPIPSMTATPGIRMQEIRALVARSLGVDLLGQ